MNDAGCCKIRCLEELHAMETDFGHSASLRLDISTTSWHAMQAVCCFHDVTNYRYVQAFVPKELTRTMVEFTLLQAIPEQTCASC